jgi:hypothetical protein
MHYLFAFFLSCSLAMPVHAAESLAGLRAEAEQGDTDAAYQLAVAYRDGKDVPKDYVEAYAWFDVAAAILEDQPVAEREELMRSMSTDQLVKAQQRSRDYFKRYVEPLLREGD